MSHTKDLISLEWVKILVEKIKSELLTPYGLRTLSYKDKKYIGKYQTFVPQKIKDQAYHNGTVWPWLLGHYIDTIKVLCKDEKSFNNEKQVLLNSLLEMLIENGSIPEIFDGDYPHNSGGTVSQLWSVAEVIRHYG